MIRTYASEHLDERPIVHTHLKDTILMRCRRDTLCIIREGCNNYTIHFGSCTGNSWIHADREFSDVYNAIKTFEAYPFEEGWFEY